jgi:HPt (histidine-containing phosphotransfer) domain-containing protein
MMLLSEVADKIRNEILTWPSHRKMVIRTHVSPLLVDAREGNEGTLIEMMMMPVGLIPEAVSTLDIEISGSNEKIMISFDFKNYDIEERLIPHWNRLMVKASEWNPRFGSDKSCLSLFLDLPSAAVNPPVNLEAMARESGIRLDESRYILKAFMGKARTQLEILQDLDKSYGTDERFRAAHSLKGAGKTLRAPELAAAARAVESRIAENLEAAAELGHLMSAWIRIEQWFEGESV